MEGELRSAPGEVAGQLELRQPLPLAITSSTLWAVAMFRRKMGLATGEGHSIARDNGFRVIFVLRMRSNLGCGVDVDSLESSACLVVFGTLGGVSECLDRHHSDKQMLAKRVQ